MSQIRVEQSQAPEAKIDPEGFKAPLITLISCPLNSNFYSSLNPLTIPSQQNLSLK